MHHTHCLYQECVARYVRGYSKAGQADRFNWTALLAKGCYHDTPLGPIAQFDGEIIVDNPKFVKRGKVFSPADTRLVVDDLKPWQA